MNKILKTSMVASATMILSLVGFGQAFGYGGGGGGAPPSFSGSVGGSITTNTNTSGSISGNGTLSLNGGPNAVRMAISNSPDFSGVSQELYSTTREWTIVPGQPVYVRFFDANGAFSDTVINGTSANNSSGNSNSTGNSGSGSGEVLGVKIELADDLISTLKFGTRNDDVKILQTELRRLGYFPSNVGSTGFYGPITRAAVAKYLTAKNGNVLGEKIVRVEGLLPKVKFGTRSNDVKLLQTELKKAGFYPSNWLATGYYGSITKAAVEKYLAANQ